jgi:hypothetical protein
MYSTREKETIIAIMVGCIIIFAIFSLKLFIAIALIIGLAGLVSDKLTHLIHKIWQKFAKFSGTFMSGIILGAIFIFVLLPTAFLAKVFRKDNIMRTKGGETYYTKRNIVFEPKDLINPW